jgi:SAM-dependent methyltransferase
VTSFGPVSEPKFQSEPPPEARDDWEAHWSSYDETNARNPAQAYRRRLLFELLELQSSAEPVRLVELGCGTGTFARDLAAAHPNVEFTGLDVSAAGLAIAARRVPSARFLQCDLTKPVTVPPGLAGWATHVVCSEVLEHVDDPVAFLRNARPFLAPGCRIVITVPGGPMSAFDYHIGHRRHFTTELLRQVIEESGLRLEFARGAGFPFFNLYRLVVFARGKAVIRDAELMGDQKIGWAARTAMNGFDWLFRWNPSSTTRGWQLVARALEPSREHR